MAGYILILAIILLGGAIATVGDRIGSRVGKARLSLFNLRPKKTAVLVTILTGSVTAATTLGLMLAANRQLRDIVFKTESIIRQNQKVQKELDEAVTQKADIQKELSVTRADLTESVRRLRNINESLKVALTRQKSSEANLKKLRSRYELAQATLRKAGTQVTNLRAQIGQLSAQRQRLDTERQRLIVQRDQIQVRLKQANVQRQSLEAAAAAARARIRNVEQQKQGLETAIAQSTQQLADSAQQQADLQASVNQIRAQLDQAASEQAVLRQQREQLSQDIADLEENRQRLVENLRVLLLGLRRGNVTIRAGQVLASGVVQNLTSREQALTAINALLQQARRQAIILTNPQNLRPEQQVVQMTNEDVEGLLKQVGDGNTYAVRILSALNYLEGENQVIVVPQTAPNRQIFGQGEQVATIALNPSALSDEQILSRINSVFAVANRRAIETGVLPDPVTGTVGSFRQIDLFRFVLALKQRNPEGTIEIQAVTSAKIYSAGPLTLTLAAIKNGQVILRSS
jgi:uncharacterized protein (DUF3084 family)